MDRRQIRVYSRKSRVDLCQLQDLLNTTAFWARNRTLEDLRIAIAHSNPVVSAWKGQRMIGFARANSDCVFRATIWDVIVHPNYQGLGLGKKLVSQILAHPYVTCVERVYLMTTHQQHFYESVGFRTNQTTTMVALNPQYDSDLQPGEYQVDPMREAGSPDAA